MSQLASIDIASQPSGIGLGKCPPYELGTGSFTFVLWMRAKEPEHLYQQDGTLEPHFHQKFTAQQRLSANMKPRTMGF